MTAEAKIRITAQDDSAPAFKKAIANLDALKASAGGISSIGGLVAGGLAVVGLSVAGLFDKFKSAIDGLDRLNDLRDATGASIENLSALEDVAARTGTSMDTVSTAVIKFNKVLSVNGEVFLCSALHLRLSSSILPFLTYHSELLLENSTLIFKVSNG